MYNVNKLQICQNIICYDKWEACYNTKSEWGGKEEAKRKRKAAKKPKDRRLKDNNKGRKVMTKGRKTEDRVSARRCKRQGKGERKEK